MPNKYIISGGGTGGHIFPAIAIANEIKSRQPDAEILFVGAKDRMEMSKVPEAGYPIQGLWISGIQRKLTLKNLLVPFKLVYSLATANKILSNFKPNVVIGVGGYASAAVLFAASRKKIPTLIQEQNSFAGITNKWLGKRVNKICVAYNGMNRFFPSPKIILTGNPVRKNLLEITNNKSEALAKLGLDPNKKTVLVTGGSLGSKSLNEAIRWGIEGILSANIQLIWQTGSFYYPEYKEIKQEGCVVLEFIKEMDIAYTASDLVVCRAGALTLAEICVLGKASILVPSPFVTEDHQTHNAMQLVNNKAAVIIKDKDVVSDLSNAIVQTLSDPEKLQSLSINSKKMGIPNATSLIVDEIEKLIK